MSGIRTAIVGIRIETIHLHLGVKRSGKYIVGENVFAFILLSFFFLAKFVLPVQLRLRRVYYYTAVSTRFDKKTE